MLEIEGMSLGKNLLESSSWASTFVRDKPWMSESSRKMADEVRADV